MSLSSSAAGVGCSSVLAARASANGKAGTGLEPAASAAEDAVVVLLDDTDGGAGEGPAELVCFPAR